MSSFVELLTENFGALASGFWVTCRLVVGSFLLAAVVGTLVAALRIAPSKWLQRLGGVYVETFRNVPLLVLLVISYAGLRRSGVAIDTWTAGIGALGLYTGAYFAEVLRSGVFAVSRGQIEASLSLGFSYAETLRRIVLPQAARTVISPMGSITIAMIKNSAIVGRRARRQRHPQGSAHPQLAHLRDRGRLLLGRRRLPAADPRRDGRHPRPRTALRDPAVGGRRRPWAISSIRTTGSG